jgi:hypothetical protein
MAFNCDPSILRLYVIATENWPKHLFAWDILQSTCLLSVFSKSVSRPLCSVKVMSLGLPKICPHMHTFLYAICPKGRILPCKFLLSEALGPLNLPSHRVTPYPHGALPKCWWWNLSLTAFKRPFTGPLLWCVGFFLPWLTKIDHFILLAISVFDTELLAKLESRIYLFIWNVKFISMSILGIQQVVLIQDPGSPE